jgi:hypothetical protein
MSQAFFLTFCLAGGLGCLALVLSTSLPSLGSVRMGRDGELYYLMIAVSPYAGYA